MIYTESKIYDGIEVRAQKPIDVRSIVQDKSDLCKLSTWPHDTYIDENGDEHHTIYMKEGMTVMVTGDKDNPVFNQYVLCDLEKILNKDYSGWKLLGSGGSPEGMNIGGNIDGGRASEYYTSSQILQVYGRGLTEYSEDGELIKEGDAYYNE